MAISLDCSLEGKTAIISGDQREWTPILALAMANAGANVVVAGSSKSDIYQSLQVVKDSGKRIIAIETDITSEREIVSTTQKAISEFGSIDILVNNARIEFGKPFVEVTESEWDQVMDFNAKSIFLFCREVGRYMLTQEKGRIVNIASGLAERGLWNSVVSCASQGAIRQLTAALALEWAQSNIRVNAIGSGWFSTDNSTIEDEQELLLRYIPSRRKGHPSDLCDLLVYLSSDACDFVTGQMIYVDGGIMAHA